MQSGNDRILKEMNRRYNVEQYRTIVNKIRNEIDDVAITSDFIAGFPSETEEEFQDTIKAIEELELDYSNTAAYSPRPITKAGKMTDKYIDAHFDDIRNHGSDIETRLDDSDCTTVWLKNDNQKNIEGFGRTGDQVILIDKDYESAIREALNLE